MRKISFYIFIAVVALFPVISFAYSGTRQVSNTNDSYREIGSLRTILDQSCVEEGDDIIEFAPTVLSEIHITLSKPLIIPKDCKGKISIHGSAQAKTILDASQITGGGQRPGDACTLFIYSEGNEVSSFTFLGMQSGAGVCVFGQNNTVKSNFFGDRSGSQRNQNKYGVVVSSIFKNQFPQMDAEGTQLIGNNVASSFLNGFWINADQALLQKNNITGSKDDGVLIFGTHHQILDNEISGNGGSGLWIEATDSTVAHNKIMANGGCPNPNEVASFSLPCIADHPIGGAGITIAGKAHHLLIGGDNFDQDRNSIGFNHDGGVVMEGDDGTSENTISHNSLTQNFGKQGNLDLGNDGLTLNDLFDADQGPNHLLNFADSMQAFPFMGTDGKVHFWVWGLAREGESVEVYQVADEDVQRAQDFGGGDIFLGDVSIQNQPSN